MDTTVRQYPLPRDLEKPPVGVAGVSAGEEVLKIVLGYNKLDSFDIVGIVLLARLDFLHNLVIQCAHRVLHILDTNGVTQTQTTSPP